MPCPAIARALLALVMVVTGPYPEAAGDEAGAKDILWTEKKLYSYRNEELIIRDFFQDRRDGVFVEIGCAWPIKNSNTYYLEKHLGWGGIGVDGLADFAAGWKESRPRSVFVNALVTARSDEPEKFYKVFGWSMSTAELDVARSLPVVAEIQVPGITLDDLLARQGVTDLDFLSIDVEGHQKAVLEGFDIERWKPKLVCIEDDGPLSVAWFKQRGYEPIERYRLRDIVNWYFAPTEEARAANARETEHGREEARQRAELLAKEPPGSMPHVYLTPKYVLDSDGNAVENPRWHPPLPTPGDGRTLQLRRQQRPGSSPRHPSLDSAPGKGERAAVAFRSPGAANPAEQRGAHRLVQVEMLGLRRALELRPERVGQAHRAHGRRPPGALRRATAAQQDGVRRELGHLPEREQRRPAQLARASEGIPSHRTEAREIDRAVEGIGCGLSCGARVADGGAFGSSRSAVSSFVLGGAGANVSRSRSALSHDASPFVR